MNQLKDVKVAARALIGDPDGDFADDDYILPFINIAYTRAISYLANTCSPFMTKLIQVPGIPAGTTNLSSFQVIPQTGAQASGQAGAPLTGLRTPLSVFWKVAGQPENNYREAEEKKTLPFLTPGNYVMGQKLFWTWRSYKLYCTPLSYPTDWAVEGEFRPPALVDDDQEVEVHPDAAVPLGFSVAALIGGERVNASYLTTWKQEASNAWDDIAAELSRKEQSTSQRLGRYTGRRR